MVDPFEVVGTMTVLFSVFTQAIVWATALKSRIHTIETWRLIADVVVMVIVKVAAELLVTVLIFEVIGTVAALVEAVIALLVVKT